MSNKYQLYSIQNIFSIAVPMILSAISIPMLGIVDTAILGHLEDPIYLAAINIGATIFNVLFWGFGFLKMSTTGLIAQSHGAKKLNKINHQMTQALIIAVSISMVLILFQNWIGSFALYLISEGGKSANMAKEYFDIRIMTAPATLIIYVLFGYFLAIQKTKIVLLIMLVNQVGNMILDYLFVIEFGWGVAGVAWGTLISEYAALITGIFYLLNSHYEIPKMNAIIKLVKSKKELKQIFILNRDIFIRTLCLMVVFALMTKGSARLGNLALAANAVLLNFFYLMSYGLDGFAHAVESLCGQAYGAKNKLAVKLIMRQVFIISFIIAIIFSVIYLIWGTDIVSLLTSLKNVQEFASDYIIWLVIIPIISMPSFVYDGFFIATTEAKIMRNSMVMATVFCYIPLWYFSREYDNHGLWMAFLSFFIVRTIAIHIYYNNWMKNWEPSVNEIIS